MPTFVPARPRTATLITGSILLLGAGLGACSSTTSPTTPPPVGATMYVGLIAASDGKTGPLNITFASAVSAPPVIQASGGGPSLAGGAPVSATGTLNLAGSAPATITGTLDSGTLTMSGGGWTLTGTLSNGKITGTFTGPALESGSLSAIGSTTNSPAVAFCGTYSGQDFTTTPASSESGSFSVVIAGTIVLGSAVSSGGTTEDFAGTATSTAITIQKTTSQGTLNASGTYNSTGTTGSYNTKVGSFTASSGTFTGGICQ